MSDFDSATGITEDEAARQVRLAAIQRALVNKNSRKQAYDREQAALQGMLNLRNQYARAQNAPMPINAALDASGNNLPSVGGPAPKPAKTAPKPTPRVTPRPTRKP